MSDRMEKEMERTIASLKASMPSPEHRNVPVFTLLRLAANEMNPVLLLLLLAGMLLCSVVTARALSTPMLTAFCTAPMPMLLLFHQYVLNRNDGMRELEKTFLYSYNDMLIARYAVIAGYMFASLVILSMTLHISAGENLLRLALCGAIPTIYLSTLLLALSNCIRNQESLPLIAFVLWLSLCYSIVLLPFDRLLQICSTLAYAIFVAIGLLLQFICSRSILKRRHLYAAALR